MSFFVLRKRLQQKLPAPGSPRVTRETILAEHARLVAAGAFDNAESLLGRYARPGLDLSFEELEAGISEFANEWEQELDDIFDGG